MSTSDADAVYNAVLVAVLFGIPLVLHVRSRFRASRAGLHAMVPNGTPAHSTALASLGIGILALIAGFVTLGAPRPRALAWDVMLWGGALVATISAFAVGYTSGGRRKAKVKRDRTARGRRRGRTGARRGG